MTRNCLLLWILLLGATAWGREWNVSDEGAVGDGKKNDTDVFQRVLDEAGQAGGGIVNVPAGRYCILGNLVIPGGVTLQGTFRVPPTPRHEGSPEMHGSVLLAYAGRGSNQGKPFIRLGGHMATLAGMIIDYPQWNTAEVPPVPYPPCILAEDAENVGILDCCLINPYEGIRLIRAARHLIRNVYGYPSWRGLYVDECYDIGRVENCHFWPFGIEYKADKPYCRWINLNGVAFEFARTDWQYVLNTFCFGYGVGYKFSESAKGSCNGNFVGIGSDCARRAVLVEQAAPYGLLITNGEFVGRWSSQDSVGVEILPQVTGNVSLNNCAFWGPLDRCIWARGAGAQLTVASCNFQNWDFSRIGSPAIQIDAGGAIVQGNTFKEGKKHVLVGPEARSAIVMANQAPGGLDVHNAAGKHCQLVGNEENIVEWTDKAREHYRIHVGRRGDERYLEHWFDQEAVNDQPQRTSRRWSGRGAQLILPVRTQTEYKLKAEMTIPSQALGPDAGLYLDGQKIAGFSQAGPCAITARIPPTDRDTITITVHCPSWVPKKLDPKSEDARELGVTLHSVTLKAEGIDKHPIFNANTGQWTEKKE